MSIQLPEQPWQEGDDFIVEETGVRYVYDGEKWLSESGEAADLSGFATKAFVDEVDRTSQMRDDALQAQAEEWDVANTAVHVKLEQQIIREAKYSDDQDAKLQEQIDALAAGDVDLSPVEDRLDDIEAVLPKTPAVIDPVEIGGQTLKITGNRPSGAGGEAGSVLMWKAEAGNGGSPYNECKFVVPDTSVVDPDAAAIWWKQGDKTQRWDMGGSGWFTSSNVLHYSAAETFGDTLVDGLPIELFYVDPNASGDDLIDTISRVESKADDRKLQAEIEELSLIVADAINAVQRDHGAWIYAGDLNSTPRDSGQFTLLTNDLTQNDNIVTLNTTDADGKMHGFNADIEAGEYLEIVDETDPDDYALFVLVEAPTVNGTLAEFKVALKKSSREGFELGDRCQVRIIHLDESNINLEELDTRYLKLSGGTMTGILELPRFNVKKLDGEAVCLIEGMTDGNATSARLTFSNKTNAGAYGNLTWNGNSDQGWFQFNKDVDLSNKNLQSVNNIRLSGNKTIQESTNTRIKFENKVVITKPGANGANRGGFVLKGGVDGNSDGNLLSVYHNASGLDSVDYYGKQEGVNNIATVGYVDSKAGGGGGSPVSAKLQAGFQLWSGSRLAEGCFNLLDENGSTTSNCKVARGLTFHTYQGFDDWPWMKYALRSGGQIHLTDTNGKYLMSKPVLSATKGDASSGDDPEGALWFFDFSIYGMEAETSLSGLYFLEFENCLKEK